MKAEFISERAKYDAFRKRKASDPDFAQANARTMAIAGGKASSKKWGKTSVTLPKVGGK